MACFEYFTKMKKGIISNIYLNTFWFIIIFHLAMCLILDSIHRSQTDRHRVSTGEYACLCVLLVVEWILCIAQSISLLPYMFLADIKPIVCLYIDKIIACSSIYLFIYKCDESQFSYPHNMLDEASTSYIELTLTFFNYSASEQTCTGVSDVVPTGVAAELISGIQILLFGIAYNVFIISLAILRFSEPASAGDDHGNDDKSQSLLQNSQPLTGNQSQSDFFATHKKMTASLDILNMDQYPVFAQRHFKCFNFFYHYMLFICIGAELIFAFIVFFVCGTRDECQPAILLTNIVFDVSLLILCLLCIVFKLKMIKVNGMNINLSFQALIFAYLTALLLFTILYFDLWLLTKRDNIRPAFKVVYDTDHYWAMLEHFLYYSITSFTEHGSESIVICWSGYAQLLNGIQMLVGVFFLSVVFGVGLMGMDIRRELATEEYLQKQIRSEPQSLLRAGLLTKRVSRLAVHAKMQQQMSRREQGAQQQNQLLISCQ